MKRTGSISASSTLTELVDLFNTTPLGHAQRTTIFKEIAWRKIPLSIPPHDVIRHRDVADSPAYYVLTQHNIIITHATQGGKTKISIGSIISISLIAADSGASIIQIYLTEKSSEKC